MYFYLYFNFYRIRYSTLKPQKYVFDYWNLVKIIKESEYKVLTHKLCCIRKICKNLGLKYMIELSDFADLNIIVNKLANIYANVCFEHFTRYQSIFRFCRFYLLLILDSTYLFNTLFGISYIHLDNTFTFCKATNSCQIYSNIFLLIK